MASEVPPYTILSQSAGSNDIFYNFKLLPSLLPLLSNSLSVRGKTITGISNLVQGFGVCRIGKNIHFGWQYDTIPGNMPIFFREYDAPAILSLIDSENPMHRPPTQSVLVVSALHEMLVRGLVRNFHCHH